MSNFHGFPILTLNNPHFSLDVMISGGPRLVRLMPAGSTLNLFAEVPGVHWWSPAGECYPLGGHRLWVAPEIPAVTYLPDHLSLITERTPDGVVLSHEDDYGVHYRRAMQVSLATDAPKMTVTHTVQNLGSKPFTAAPWAISQFRLGGRVILPMSEGLINDSEFTPNRGLALWPYTDLRDERLSIGNRAVLVKGIPHDEALKVGTYSTRGWGAIEFAESWVIIKRFKTSPASAYTDICANVQCYVRDQFIELETLGELTQLQPGQSVQHVEEWELLPGSLASLGLIDQG
jgi:hypothetical protein